jgi:hypothetical protein
MSTDDYRYDYHFSEDAPTRHVAAPLPKSSTLDEEGGRNHPFHSHHYAEDLVKFV